MHTQNKITAAGHTAGPWIDLIGNPWNDDHGNRMLVMTPDKRRTIAHAFNAGNIDECEANARLISAAPGLLEALEAICARIHGDFDHPALAAFGPLLNTEADIMSIASTALARAKGTA